MLRIPRAKMIAVLVVGALLGYVVASGKINYFSTADETRPTAAVKPPASSGSLQGACCKEMPANGHSLVLADTKGPDRKPEIIHDAEYYILDAQHGERWKVEDKELDAKLAELRKKHGTPPNIIHIMWDDTAVGEVGIPALQKVRGWETPNINRLAAEGINFMRMYTEPSCTPSRAACLTGRHPVRNGMYNVGFPYEYGGLAATEVTTAKVLSKAGYATAFYGKAHVGDVESSYMTNQGFDEALWMPYNQVPSLFTQQGQMSVLSPGVMFPEMFGKDPYDMDPGWRPKGFVFALEGTKDGPVREFGRAPNHEDYMKIEGECEKRTMAFIKKNAAAKKPFYCAYLAAIRLFPRLSEPSDGQRRLASGRSLTVRCLGWHLDDRTENAWHRGQHARHPNGRQRANDAQRSSRNGRDALSRRQGRLPRRRSARAGDGLVAWRDRARSDRRRHHPRDRPVHHLRSPRRCDWSTFRPTASSTASIRRHCSSRATLSAGVTTFTSTPARSWPQP